MVSIFWIYDYLLERSVKKEDVFPDHIGVILDLEEFKDGKIDKFLDWCSEFDIERVSIYVSIKNEDKKIESKEKEELNNKLDQIESVSDRKKLDMEKNGVRYDVSFGLGGRKEFINVLKDLGKEIKKDNSDLDDIDRDNIEDKLIFEGEPDLFIKTGSEHLSDFMLWQSVYSEHYFADFNWESLRKRDFLRVIRDFQKRERRFGR